MFRHALLLSQYSVYWAQYFKCSNIIIYAIFFWQLVSKTADCFNRIVFSLVVIISSKKVCEKMGNNSKLEKVLLVCKRNAELLHLVGLTIAAILASLRRRKINLIILKSLKENKIAKFCFICLSLLTFELKCSENFNMLIESIHDSDVF